MFSKKTILILFFLFIGGVETTDCTEWYLNFPTEFDCLEQQRTSKSTTITTTTTTTKTSTTTTEEWETVVPSFEPTSLPPIEPAVSSTITTTISISYSTVTVTEANATSSGRQNRTPWWLSLWAVIIYW